MHCILSVVLFLEICDNTLTLCWSVHPSFIRLDSPSRKRNIKKNQPLKATMPLIIVRTSNDIFGIKLLITFKINIHFVSSELTTY